MSLTIFGYPQRHHHIIPIGFGGFHRHYPDPMEWAGRQMQQSLAMLDKLFDEEENVQLRNHTAKLSINEGDFTYQLDVRGFRPEELKVEMQGNELIVQGEHKEQNENESVHRQFERRLVIPEHIQKESIRCDWDNQGRLSVTGKRNAVDQKAPRTIPIEFNKANKPVDVQQAKGEMENNQAPQQEQQQQENGK